MDGADSSRARAGRFLRWMTGPLRKFARNSYRTLPADSRPAPNNLAIVPSKKKPPSRAAESASTLNLNQKL